MNVWWGLVQLALLLVAIVLTIVLWVPVFSGAITGATLLLVIAWFAFLASLYLCPEVSS